MMLIIKVLIVGEPGRTHSNRLKLEKFHKDIGNHQ